MGSGSDGGGSIRIPASCCGLFGLKPTRERVPLGLEEYGNIVCVHALTRTVRDSAALLDCTSGGPPGSPLAPPRNRRPFLRELDESPRRLRIGMVLSAALASAIDPECRKAVERSARICQDLGHDVDDVTRQYSEAFPWSQLFEAQVVVFFSGMTLRIEERLAELGRELQEDDLEPATRVWFERGKELKATELAGARRKMHEASLRMAEFQRDRDVVMTPTLGKPPIEHGILNLRRADDDVQEFLDFTPFTFIANFTGQPAMSVPLHWTADGLPVGVQFIGRYADEATLFRLAAQLEKAQPWAGKRPPI